MSVWTHVVGIINVDYLRLGDGDGATGVKLMEDILGPMATLGAFDVDTLAFERDPEALDNCKLPLGSEGSVVYAIYQHGEPNEATWATVVLRGDLRDYESIEEIDSWIREVAEAICGDDTRMWIRNGVLRAHVEFRKAIHVWTLDSGGDDTAIVHHVVIQEDGV